MAGWSGFTDDDLKRIKQTTDDGAPSLESNKRGMARRPRPQQQKGKTSRPSLSPTGTSGAVVDPAMSLSSQGKVNKISKETKPHDSTNNSHPGSDKNVQGGSGSIEVTGEKSNTGDTDGGETVPETCDVKVLDETEALSLELNNVQKFQQRQKVIEEANKHKRALLAKAIEDRRKKAKAEADKLMKVQQELNRLDTLLTADVNIIRDRIEVASLEYMDAQKRYEKAEKEFIVAKMDLFAKGEAKEHLTEHLYTIIHQNEVRKAKKLVELMEKLAMEVTPEEMELTIPAIPQLTNFTAVATIHDPNHHHHNVSRQNSHTDKVKEKIEDSADHAAVTSDGGGGSGGDTAAHSNQSVSDSTSSDSQPVANPASSLNEPQHHQDQQQNQESASCTLEKQASSPAGDISTDLVKSSAPVPQASETMTSAQADGSAVTGERSGSEVVTLSGTPPVSEETYHGSNNTEDTNLVPTTPSQDKDKCAVLASALPPEQISASSENPVTNKNSARGWTHPFS